MLKAISYLISNHAKYFPIVLFFILLSVKMIVYSAARRNLSGSIEQIGVDFCSIGFAFFVKAIFDQSSQLRLHFSQKGSIAPAILLITLIFVLIFMLAVYLFEKLQYEKDPSRNRKKRQYGYLGGTFALGFLLVFFGINLI